MQSLGTINIIQTNQWAYINLDGIPEYAYQQIIGVCSYIDSGHKFKSAWTRSQDNGAKWLIEQMPGQPNPRVMRFPVGLMRMVSNAVILVGYTPSVIDESILSTPSREFVINSEVQVRDYQNKVVETAMNSNRGIMCCPTGSGKTLMAGLIIGKSGYAHNIFLVHRKELLKQTIGMFKWLFPEEKIGAIGAGYCDIQPITIAMIQTVSLALNDPNMDEYGLDYSGEDGEWVASRRHQIVQAVADAEVIFVDECHGIKSRTVFGSTMAFPQPVKIYGMSATPKGGDDDDLWLYGAFNDVLINIRPIDLIKQGYLLMPMIRFIRYDASEDLIPITCTNTRCKKISMIGTDHNPGPKGIYICQHCKQERKFQYGYVHKAIINQNEKLHEKIVAEIQQEIDRDYIVAVCVTHIELGENMVKRIPGAVLLTSKDSDDRRETVFNALRARELKCLVTTLMSEGVDVPALDTIVIMDGKDEGMYRQRIGRTMRRNPDMLERKYGHVIDVYYENCIFLAKHSRIRYKCCEDEEFLTMII